MRLKAVFQGGAEAIRRHGELPFEVGVVPGGIGPAEQFPGCAQQHLGFRAFGATQRFEPSAQFSQRFLHRTRCRRGSLDAKLDPRRVQPGHAHMFGGRQNAEGLS